MNYTSSKLNVSFIESRNCADVIDIGITSARSHDLRHC